MKKINMEVSVHAEGMTSEAKAGKHAFVIDEGTRMGGKDSGPNPLQSVLGALAACENVTARMAAKEMNFTFDSMDFQVRGEFDPRGFMGEPGVRPYFETVTIETTVKTEETEELLNELKEKVEARCPVYTMMKEAGVTMHDTWKKA
ncbi:osmotically inducible protein C [Alteribacter lacisalsi]|uniref:Osmotically inducible protein C n=1 Tax=Alteribacter lacisalsi TaxID=2045244 RepID=A0A2W0H9A2_9BACI|nr:OsmC family protein [Alteribacter lacisalsi]PYZ97511.1 osmotically inducible protein C [Alteribacter lacisalsi]